MNKSMILLAALIVLLSAWIYLTADCVSSRAKSGQVINLREVVDCSY
jgi:hypothetical protein